MSEYLIRKETLDNIAVQSMELAGKTEAVTTAEITNDLAAANDEIVEQTDLLEQLEAALINKTAGSSTQLDPLTNPGNANTMLKGTEMLNAIGKKVVGTIPTISIPDVEISVNNAGRVSAVQTNSTAGYMQATSATKTYDLPTQAATTIIPSKTEQTAVSAYKYTTGAIKVAGDSNLVPENIRGGVSIFGVTGNIPTSALPSFTYTGSYETIDEGNENWKIRFLTSGTLRLTSGSRVDIFAVGGGGGGGKGANVYTGGEYISYSGCGGGGGGGGYTAKVSGVTLVANTDYVVTIGAGGAQGTDGGASSFASNVTANGGKGATNSTAYTGYVGDGGSGGGGGATTVNNAAWDACYGAHGGSDGSNGIPRGTSSNYKHIVGMGQGTTTREFHETTGTLYAGGGGGGAGQISASYPAGAAGAGGGGKGAGEGTGAQPGQTNTGGGGGGGSTGAYDTNSAGMPGGSGIVIIRNAR